MASRKVDFALAVVGVATQAVDVLNNIDALADIWTASGYASGGSNPITDNDLAGHDISAAQLADFVSFAVNFKKFMEGNAPAQADYAKSLNQFVNVAGTL